MEKNADIVRDGIFFYLKFVMVFSEEKQKYIDSREKRTNDKTYHMLFNCQFVY